MARMRRVYFDHNATTPLDPRVKEAMLPWLGERHGNPSSVHGFGQAAREAVERAREQVAHLLQVRPGEVVFTASGTEANNAVLWHVAREARFRGHLLLSTLEHPSVSVTADLLAEAGMEVERVPPEANGVVEVEAMVAALRPDTRLVCLMLANNELGTLQPVPEVAAAARERGVPVLCDAVQAAGKIPVEVNALGADYVTIGAHKFHGPLGAAALWISPDVTFSSLLTGGSQERRRRSGTESVPSIVGFGKAAELAAAELPERHRHLLGLRTAFEDGLGAVAGTVVHCRRAPRLPHTSHVAFSGVEGEALLIRLDLAGFAVSTGSACASGVVEPSPTLLSMGIEAAEALASIRVSFGMPNTADEVRRFLERLSSEVAALRELLPLRASS